MPGQDAKVAGFTGHVKLAMGMLEATMDAKAGCRGGQLRCHVELVMGMPEGAINVEGGRDAKMASSQAMRNCPRACWT